MSWARRASADLLEDEAPHGRPAKDQGPSDRDGDTGGEWLAPQQETARTDAVDLAYGLTLPVGPCPERVV
jgi:hypothetical protein